MSEREMPAFVFTTAILALFFFVLSCWVVAVQEGPNRRYTLGGRSMPGEQHMWYARLRPGQRSVRMASPYDRTLGIGDDFCMRWWVGPGATTANVNVERKLSNGIWRSYQHKHPSGYRTYRNYHQWVVTPVRFTGRGKDVDVIYAWYEYSAGNCGYQGVYPRSPIPEPERYPALHQKLVRLFQ